MGPLSRVIGAWVRTLRDRVIMLASIVRDFRYTVRSVSKLPGFAVVAVFILTLVLAQLLPSSACCTAVYRTAAVPGPNTLSIDRTRYAKLSSLNRNGPKSKTKACSEIAANA